MVGGLLSKRRKMELVGTSHMVEGVYIGTAIMKNCTEVPQKLKNRTSLYFWVCIPPTSTFNLTSGLENFFS
jgi:hypothetical protein